MDLPRLMLRRRELEGPSPALPIDSDLDRLLIPNPDLDRVGDRRRLRAGDLPLDNVRLRAGERLRLRRGLIDRASEGLGLRRRLVERDGAPSMDDLGDMSSARSRPQLRERERLRIGLDIAEG